MLSHFSSRSFIKMILVALIGITPLAAPAAPAARAGSLSQPAPRQGDLDLVAEAARYLDVGLASYLRLGMRDSSVVLATRAMAYSYGNFDSVEDYVEKLEEASEGRVVEAWQDYDPDLRPGRFDREWTSSSWYQWAGIDCGGLIQRASDEVLSDDGTHRYELSREAHLSSERDDGANKIGSSEIMNNYTVVGPDGHPTDYSIESTAEVGDIIGWGSDGWYGHVGLVYAIDRQTPSESIVIHAGVTPLASAGGRPLWNRSVQLSDLSFYSRAGQTIRRLRPAEGGVTGTAANAASGAAGSEAGQAATPGEPVGSLSSGATGPVGSLEPPPVPYNRTVVYLQGRAATTITTPAFTLLSFANDTGDGDSHPSSSLAPGPMAVAPSGEIYALDPAAGRITVLGPDGQLLGHLARPNEIATYTDIGVSAAGEVYALAIFPEAGVDVFSSSGSFLRTVTGDFGLPIHLQVYPDGAFDLKSFTADGQWWVHHYGPAGERLASESAASFDQSLYAPRDYDGAIYRAERVGESLVRLQRQEPQNIDYLAVFEESPGDLANRIIGFDRFGRLYRLLTFRVTGSDDLHSYVEVIDPEGGSAYLVDLGAGRDMSGSNSRVTVDANGNIYHLSSEQSGLELVRYSPAGPGLGYSGASRAPKRYPLVSPENET